MASIFERGRLEKTNIMVVWKCPNCGKIHDSNENLGMILANRVVSTFCDGGCSNYVLVEIGLKTITRTISYDDAKLRTAPIYEDETCPNVDFEF